MVHIPEIGSTFKQKPEIPLEKIAHYFNLEFSRGSRQGEAFVPEDFEYLGCYVLEGSHTMYWKVRGRERLFAIAVPFQASYMLSMTDVSPSGLEFVD